MTALATLKLIFAIEYKFRRKIKFISLEELIVFCKPKNKAEEILVKQLYSLAEIPDNPLESYYYKEEYYGFVKKYRLLPTFAQYNRLREMMYIFVEHHGMVDIDWSQMKDA